MSQLYYDTIAQLRECYDTHAHKFSSTRKKHWPEVERIIKKIKTEEKKEKLTIVELWCGDGRLWTALSEQGITIQHYHGVDISEELITQAKKRSSGQKQVVWKVNDMLSELKTMASESCDMVIAMASFQHLPDIETRNAVLREIYRVLRYDGQFVTIDRSWSRWMLRKHWKLLLRSLGQSVMSLGRRERNNLMIPFSSADKSQTHHRLYHIFTMKELAMLLQVQGFVIQQMIYSAQDGSFHQQWSNARNICTAVRKQVFVGE